MRTLAPALTLAALVAACGSTPVAVEPSGFAAEIAAAHGAASLYDMPPLHAHVSVTAGGAEVLDADMVFDAASGRVRLEADDGRVAVFDGTDAWAVGVPPEELPVVRFHLLTWSYFVAAPWKLGDPGSSLGPVERRELRGAAQDAALLTFADGVGDTPDDWYVVYADPDSRLLTALAYIVTFAASVAEAEVDPHAATYDGLVDVDGLRVPAELTIWSWREDQGLTGDPLGQCAFTELRFAAAADDAFAPPPGAQRIDAPN